MNKVIVIGGGAAGMMAAIAAADTGAQVTLYEKNEKHADELQDRYGLTMTLHDLFAWEELTEEEVIGIQQYKDYTP